MLPFFSTFAARNRYEIKKHITPARIRSKLHQLSVRVLRSRVRKLHFANVNRRYFGQSVCHQIVLGKNCELF